MGLANRHGLPEERVVLGGDHLGPNRWQELPAEEAMGHAEELIAAYVDAGFTKIAPTTNALAPVLTIALSLAIYQTLPTVYAAIGMVLAIVGPTLMVYSDEKRGEASDDVHGEATIPLVADKAERTGRRYSSPAEPGSLAARWWGPKSC